MAYLVVGGLSLFVLVLYVIGPQYLEFRRTVGLSQKVSEANGVIRKLTVAVWGLKSQVTGAAALFMLALPPLVEYLKMTDLSPYLTPDHLKWATLILGLLSFYFTSTGRLAAAKAEPVKRE